MIWKQIFDTFDTDQDGRISKKELQIAAEKRAAKAKELKEATKRLAVRELLV